MGIFGSVAALGGSIFGGISATKAMNKVKENVEKMKQDNEDWYNRRYNEDATERADAQRVLQKTRDSIRERNRQAAGAQAVMGGTEESVAAARASNNEALAETASRISAAADSRKDQIEQQYLSNKQSLNEKLNDIEVGKANAIGEAVKGASQAMGSMPF